MKKLLVKIDPDRWYCSTIQDMFNKEYLSWTKEKIAHMLLEHPTLAFGKETIIQTKIKR